METEGKKAGKFGAANGAVMDKLIEAGNLLARGRVGAQLSAQLALQGAGDLPQHAPVVHPHGRAGDRSALGGKTLREIGRCRPSPTPPSTRTTGRTRIRSMVESRPDWLIIAPARLGHAARPCSSTRTPASR